MKTFNKMLNTLNHQTLIDKRFTCAICEGLGMVS